MKTVALAALDAGTPIGGGGLRLLGGNCEEHELLKADAAKFLGASPLFLGGGYVANFALLTNAAAAGDLLVLDSLVHASVNGGASR